MEAIGIGEGALRTALSRLVADGTLERSREGRASFHRLAGAGGFDAAERLIYRARAPSRWTMGTGEAPPRALALSGGWLAEAPFGQAPQVTGALAGAGEPEPAHAASLLLLAADLDALDVPQTPLDAMAARTLLVHRWRRIVLRWPELPASWTGIDARARVAEAWRALLPPSEAWLDRHMPPASEMLRERFVDRAPPAVGAGGRPPPALGGGR